MKLIISKIAAKWYKKELAMSEGQGMRFAVRYGGIGGRIPGFSLGIQRETPQETDVQTVIEGINFFIRQEDTWYFEGKNLHINMDHAADEPSFTYKDA